MDPKFHVPDDAAELKEYIELIKIPSVTFLMGSSADNTKAYSNEHPQHVVTIPSFLMGRYPVTQYQYKKVMGNNPSRFKGANRPVETVSWNEAVEFCQKLSEQSGKNYRLPTEAEWEHACRAGTTTSYFFGESLAKTQANYDYGSDSTTDVGSFQANDFGLYDMHGNVWEWCLDHWHDNYQGAPTNGSAWITDGDSNKRILRGGSWSSVSEFCRSANRHRHDPDDRFSDDGFRVVCVN
jgi:formylglycine-generating enzyme required for sulfatase activity